MIKQCEGCNQARNQAFKEIAEILNQEPVDFPYIHYLTVKYIKQELGKNNGTTN
jgi:hypothetical protein